MADTGKTFESKEDWVNSLSIDDLDFLFDCGLYNNTIRGYLILAARYAGFDEQSIDKLMKGANKALEEHDRDGAENTFFDW